MSRIAALAGLMAFAVAAPALAAPSPEEIATAERAFAADGLARGVGPSFVTWAAPDGIILAPDPKNAREVYGSRPAPKPDAPKLKWWPMHAGIALSGDLGFDTGPWVFGDDKAHGFFLTIWARQPDGSWKWLLDNGIDAKPSSFAPGSPTQAVKVAAEGTGSAASAFEQVKAEEAKMASQLAAGKLTSAYASRLSEDAWLAGLEAGGPKFTAESVAAALPYRPQTMTTEPLGGGASKAGDLAYTFGRARWTGVDGKAVEARYVRVWQHRGKGWKLILDQIGVI
ncbi:MAG: nuclear transport factor 2 family protein [Proteobacteria bacterium]|nr:nuclear transport factor 2 family protein [Pseudomonadota bacterium]